MPIDEIAGSVFGAVFRFIGWIFIDFFIEIMVKGLGYAVCRPFKKIDIESFTALIVGTLAWVVLIFLIIVIAKLISANIQIDSCFDNGGRYNYQESSCEYE